MSTAAPAVPARLPAQAGPARPAAPAGSARPAAPAGSARQAAPVGPTRQVTPAGSARQATVFRVRLDDFDGPFDLLLGLIASHELDVTHLALARVTDDFLTHLRELSAAGTFDLDQASEFVVVAATLLDLKAARLLPRGEVEDADDLAAFEARDLLFVRLLQYRAYKAVAQLFRAQMAEAARRFPAAVGPGDDIPDPVPEVLLGLTPARFAELAARVAAPRPDPVVGTGHLHAAPVSVAAQAALLRERLISLGTATFAELTADAPGLATVIARFLALLDLFRDGAVVFTQNAPLAELSVTSQPAAVGQVGP